MAKPIVTFESVSDAAQALIQEGLTPTILLVKERIGGGSFTTVKKHLDSWREAQASNNSDAPPTPASVADKAAEFARTIWSVAHQEAQQAVTRIQAEAKEQIGKLRIELSDTHREIASLESVETLQAGEIAVLKNDLAEKASALQQSQLIAQRVPDLEKALQDLKDELALARQKIVDLSADLGHAKGENEVLQKQLSSGKRKA